MTLLAFHNDAAVRRGRPREDLAGRKYGRLTVLALSRVCKNGAGVWECVCDCGSTAIVFGSSLKHEKTASCGCYRREISRDSKLTHGMSKSVEYKTWRAMHHRCSNPNNPFFGHYGGRGISVCDRWGAFEAFLSDMGSRPSPQHSIDRINNDGGYSPDNCRWATRKEQMNNTRLSREYSFSGTKMSLRMWAKEIGMKHVTLYRRVHFMGWAFERAITTPLRGSKQ